VLLGYDHFLQELAAGSGHAHADEQLDEEVAERPQDLVSMVERGGRHAVGSVRAIIETLKTLDNDETLLVQSGKPVVFSRRTSTRRVC